TNEDGPHQPGEAGCRGFEFWGGAEVNLRLIDGFACVETRNYFRRSVAHADIGDVDQLACVGLEDVARLYFGKTVGADDLVVDSAGQKFAFERRTFECSRANGDYAAETDAGFANEDRLRYFAAQFENEL